MEFQTTWHAHLGAHFRDANRSSHSLHTTLSRGSAFLPSTDQTGLFRLLGGQTTLSFAELGSEFSAIMFFSLPSASATVFVASHFQQ